MIVVDATVLGDLLIGRADIRQSAEKLIQEDPDWISVSLWRYELGNILWKSQRIGALEAGEGPRILEGSEALISETIETLDVSEILAVAEQRVLSFYDASYVWLARSRRLRLRTRDNKILSQCPDIAQRMPG